LYKRIENLKVYHRKGFHKKVVKINFNDLCMQIFDNSGASKPDAVIWLAQIQAISVTTEQKQLETQ